VGITLLVATAVLMAAGVGCTGAMLLRDRPQIGMIGMSALVLSAILAVAYSAVDA
jgi:hypothetical protein